jgi:osmotically-inducible protein OsmY
VADQDRNNEPRDRDRDRIGRREVYLDDRDGYGARDRGYPAEFREDRGQGRGPGYSAGHNEGHSFRDQDGRGRDEPFRETRDDYYRGESYGQASGRYGREEQRSLWSYPARSNPDFYADESGAAGPGWAETWQEGPSYSGATPSRYFGYGQGGDPHRLERVSEGGRGHRGFWRKAADTVSSWMGDDEARWRHEMDARESHRGKGPKGYRRSDERIREDVSDRLTDDPFLDASMFEVQVSGGEVTLTGMVRSKADKRHADYVVEHISGVDNVQNNLRVEKPADRWHTAGGDNFGSGLSTGSIRPAEAKDEDRLGGGTAGKA